MWQNIIIDRYYSSHSSLSENVLVDFSDMNSYTSTALAFTVTIKMWDHCMFLHNNKKMLGLIILDFKLLSSKLDKNNCVTCIQTNCWKTEKVFQIVLQCLNPSNQASRFCYNYAWSEKKNNCM